MNARFLWLVVTTLFLSVMIASGVAFAGGGRPPCAPGHGTYSRHGAGGYPIHPGHHPPPLRYIPRHPPRHWGPPARGYHPHDGENYRHGFDRAWYGVDRYVFSGSCCEPWFGFSFGTIGRW
jgi:hypothetical protein